jgi:hypothetical protein
MGWPAEKWQIDVPRTALEKNEDEAWELDMELKTRIRAVIRKLAKEPE